MGNKLISKANCIKSVIINDTDIVYSYKEPWFTGFAPCFQDGLYSLACCMGSRYGRGMRNSICRNINEGKTVWIISIAGCSIGQKGHNCSGIGYSGGDVMCLVKVSCTHTLEEYSKLYFGHRRDAIYTFENNEIIWNSNSPNGEGDHDSEDNREVDCSLKYKGWDQERIFHELEQIIVSDNYYVFEPGQRVGETLVPRGRSYECNNNREETRTEALRRFLSGNPRVAFINGQDPFQMLSCKKAGCSK